LGAAPFSFSVGDAGSTALFYRAEAARATLVLGHGAGAPQTHPWMVKVANALSARGIDVVTFNFLYAEAKRRVPDKNNVLEATWRAAIAATIAQAGVLGEPLFLGGKSMGGRIATQVAAKGDLRLAGLVLLGYPLHPPGKPEQLRAAHLPRIEAPMLFVQGSRDAFGSPDELRPVVAGLHPGTRLFVVEGGDHSLGRPKSSGETLDQTLLRVADEVARFISSR
jgi:predicted alpha/beta-hydrolase family hydrolase